MERRWNLEIKVILIFNWSLLFDVFEHDIYNLRNFVNKKINPCSYVVP